MWPRIADRTRDAFGRDRGLLLLLPPRGTIAEIIEALVPLGSGCIGDIEVHLHHDGEGEAHFRNTVGGFVQALRTEHGLLREIGGRAAFAFIHGNWALDNSHPEGRFCGLDNEITLLRELGCYADFTLPSAPSGCQTTTVNDIYWAVDDPARPKSHDVGARVVAGGGIRDGLLMVQGPLTIRRHQRRRWLPSLEAGDLTQVDGPTPHRVARWLACAPRVGSHQFLKLHTHGAQVGSPAPCWGMAGMLFGCSVRNRAGSRSSIVQALRLPGRRGPCYRRRPSFEWRREARRMRSFPPGPGGAAHSPANVAALQQHSARRAAGAAFPESWSRLEVTRRCCRSPFPWHLPVVLGLPMRALSVLREPTCR